MGTIVATVQLVLVLVMFVDAGSIVDRIEAYDAQDGETWMTRSVCTVLSSMLSAGYVNMVTLLCSTLW